MTAAADSNSARDPSYADDNLIWIDMEMTGLQPEVNRVIEVAAIITDRNLNILHEGPVVAVHQKAEILDGMDAWNTETHTKSGLVKRVLESTVDEEECSRIFREVFRRYVPEGKSPMCGNTIGHGALASRDGALLPLPLDRRLHHQGARPPLGA